VPVLGVGDEMRCPNCESQVPEESIFCSECGRPIHEGGGDFRRPVRKRGTRIIAGAGLAVIVLLLGLWGAKDGLRHTLNSFVTDKNKPQKANAEVTSEPNQMPPEPESRFPELRPFRSIQGDVVFVKKDIYGGDLEYSCSLRGRVRNISNRPYKNVFVTWAIFDEGGNLFLVWAITGKKKTLMPSLFSDQIDFLDSKSEVEFNIGLDLYSGIDSGSAKKIRAAVLAGREQAGIYVLRSADAP